MRKALVVFSLLVSTATAGAQTDPSVCRVLADPTSSAADATRTYSRSLEGSDLNAARARLRGEELAAFDDMIKARDRAAEPIRAFADRLEDLAYMLRRCAR